MARSTANGVDRVGKISVKGTGEKLAPLFDAFLCRLDAFVQPRMLELLAFFEAEAFQIFRGDLLALAIKHGIDGRIRIGNGGTP